MAGVAWTICNAPTPILWVLPNETLARSFSRNRWQPFVEGSACLVAEKPRSWQDYAILEQRFARATVAMVGSNSPANLASRPAGLVLLDETDKFPAAGPKEADAVSLALQRSKEFNGAKVVFCSTPTTTDGSIWQRYLRGDQRRYFVPCQACGHEQFLEWKRVTWDLAARSVEGDWDYDQVKRTARYACGKCGAGWDDLQRLAAVRRGHWRPTNAGALTGERSYHLSSLYAPSRSCTVGAMAVRFLQAKESIDGLMAFVQGDLAEPWQDQTLDGRAKRTEAVWVGMDPVPGGIRLMTVDVQALSPMFWVLVREWGEAGQSRLVFAGHCDQWEDMARIQLAHQVEPHRVLVDSGFNGQEVYARCMGHAKVIPRPNSIPLVVGWTPAKSREGRLVWHGPDGKRPSPYFIGRAALPPHLRIELPLVEWDAESVRDILARLRAGEDGSPAWALTPFPTGVEMVGVRRVDEDSYYLHLDSWRRKAFADGRRGKVSMKWASRTQKAADHLLDCELLQIVAAMIHKRLKISGVPVAAGS